VASDPAIVFAVVSQVGIEQVQRYAANLSQPDARKHAAARERHLDRDWCTLRREDGPNGDGIGVEPIVGLVLIPGVVDQLAEIAIAIQQPNRDQRQAKIAGGFEMIAGQDAQATRVDGQRLGNCELRAK